MNLSVAGAPITALWTALISLLLLVLMARVARLRWVRKIGLGDGGDKELTRAVRAHGNAIETMPIALLLMLVFELGGGANWLLHACGASLFIGRIAHAAGLTRSSGASAGRFVGSATWATVVIVLASAVLHRSS